MRGPLTPQPLTSPSSSLAFNGNVWAGIEALAHSLQLPLTPLTQVPAGENDGLVLLRHLDASRTEEEVVERLAAVCGPYAFVYAQEKQCIWFARDSLGRRSLLYAFSGQTLHLCSLAVEYVEPKNLDWRELPSGVLFRAHFLDSALQIQYTWLQQGVETGPLEEMRNIHPILSFQVADFRPMPLLDPRDSSQPDSDLPLLDGSVEARMDAWTQFLSTERATFLRLFKDAIRRRVETQLFQAKGTFQSDVVERVGDDCRGRVGVLFSGGVDSLALAVFCHGAMEELGMHDPIDLLNVAFQQPNSHFDVPDRLLGREAVEKLRELYPDRRWNFVEINVTKAEVTEARLTRIKGLLEPCLSVLDDSLGCALWFAARGIGQVEGERYESSARVLLSGSGADEVLGGYARHRTRFLAQGWAGLREELAMEVGRLGSRNLGRDDRVVADSGKETRLPFLDHHLLHFLTRLPLWKRVDFRLPRGMGEKLLLRCVLWAEGLGSLALTPKRAMQFGSRIAKLENRQENAGEPCRRLQ